MKYKIKVLISHTFDSWFNLATEDYIFRDMDPNTTILFLWRNDLTVVIGRFQNPWTECNTLKMEHDGIKLARRQSGGGAVFHDLGNTNFTFMNSKDTYDKNRNNQIIINALKTFGINAESSGRNDINIITDEGPKKISGSAFKETKDRCFHHGTLLINTDLTRLGEYLNPHPKKLQSKGIQSVKSRVMNLNELNVDINHETISKAIISEFAKSYGENPEVEILINEDLVKIDKLNEHYLRIKDWHWRFGEAPQFSQQMTEYFSWGLVEVHLEVEKGKIIKNKIFSDSLHPEMIELLMESLIEIPYNKSSILESVAKLANQWPMYDDYLTDFASWMVKEIN